MIQSRLRLWGDLLEAVARRFRKPGNWIQEKGKSVSIPRICVRGNRAWSANGPYPAHIETEAIPGAASLIPVEGQTTNGRTWGKLVGDDRLADFTPYAGTNTVTHAFTTIRSKIHQTGLLSVFSDFVLMVVVVDRFDEPTEVEVSSWGAAKATFQR